MSRSNTGSIIERSCWLVSRNKVQDHGAYAEQYRDRAVSDFRLLARPQGSPTGQAVWRVGRRNGAAVRALHAGGCLLSF